LNPWDQPKISIQEVKEENSKTKPLKFRKQTVKAQKERTTQKRNDKERQLGRYKNYKIFFSNVVEKYFLAKYKLLQLCKKSESIKKLKSNNKPTLGKRAIKFWL